MMHLLALGMVVAMALCAAGCARMTTKVVEKPRVDQELAGGGNRGYLMGSAPATGARKTTRKMIETDIELPTKEELNPWRRPSSQARPSGEPAEMARASAPAPALPPVRPLPPAESWEEEDLIPEPTAPSEQAPAGTTYTVQKGDTLQKIAAKFYGTSKPWRKIYEANQASLKSPDNIYPGQKLIIPPAEQETDDAGSQYK